MSTSIKKLKPLEIDFLKEFDGFGQGKWNQLGTKIGPQIDLKLKTPKIKKTHKNQLNFNDFGGSVAQVGTKNPSKIDVKNDAETERLWKQIFFDFGSIWEPSWPSKTKPRRSKIDVEITSKLDHFWKASWKAFWAVLGASWGIGAQLTSATWVRRGCDVGATPALTGSRCPQGPPLSKNTSIQDTSTG